MIKELWEKYIGLALPLKLILGAIIGIILGPGLIGFLSEYATYSYAIQLGIRPPLEGIPYLKTAVTAGSLFLTVIIALIFLISRFIASAIAVQLASYLRQISGVVNSVLSLIRKITLGLIKIPSFEHGDAISKLKSFSSKLAILFSFIVAIGFFLGFYIFFRVEGEPDALKIGVFAGIYILIALLTTWSKKAVWWVSISSAILFYAFSFFLLFNVNYYSEFLRLVGYGGGSKVTISFKEDDSISDDYYMLLRTTKSLILMSNNSSVIIEIPIEKVHKVSYKILGKGNKYKLPESPVVGNNANKSKHSDSVNAAGV
ncbi:hypothetical protein [Marinomonas sp. TW1]|uniref:hypothetical protein n=1 Tax=Marinomonas sp. TW1 TaxID=1561203 RepID=UPI0007AF0F99|nr:hypothetical protein [Marinomonas sp. TW1]KZN13991.1 hypothetical protein OA79_07875 [Marinomonas sp. TW1]